jgi:hypothetical protein
LLDRPDGPDREFSLGGHLLDPQTLLLAEPLYELPEPFSSRLPTLVQHEGIRERTCLESGIRQGRLVSQADDLLGQASDSPTVRPLAFSLGSAVHRWCHLDRRERGRRYPRLAGPVVLAWLVGILINPKLSTGFHCVAFLGR